MVFEGFRWFLEGLSGFWRVKVVLMDEWMDG